MFERVFSRGAQRVRISGFTLIELLTVIFIIGLLAALLIPAVIKFKEVAALAAAESDLRNLVTVLNDYRILNDTLPPFAGCAVVDLPADNPKPYFAWTDLVGEDMRAQFVDRFSESEDLNMDSEVGEAFPSPTDQGEGLAEDRPRFRQTNEITNEGVWEWNGRVDGDAVPYQYFPVNADNMRKFKKWLAANHADDPRADNHYDIDDFRRSTSQGGAGMRIPPPYYDQFVLFSLGPQQRDYYIIPRNATDRDELRVRAYYRVLLDRNGNGVSDYDYRSRKKNEEKGGYSLPDPVFSEGLGIMIFTGP